MTNKDAQAPADTTYPVALTHEQISVVLFTMTREKLRYTWDACRAQTPGDVAENEHRSAVCGAVCDALGDAIARIEDADSGAQP
jgi:hypothetical protein